MNRNNVLRALVIAACVGILAACGGEDGGTQAQGYGPTSETSQREGRGEFGMFSPQENQERQQNRSPASGQAVQQQASRQDDERMQDHTEGQAIPPAPAVEFRD